MEQYLPTICTRQATARITKTPNRKETEEMSMPSVLSHNQRAGATWGSGGAAYDVVSESVADGIDHVVNRVWPTDGERFLDIATGTGWTARRLAARGASVVGIDLGAPVIEAAKTLAPTIDFRVGDAESLEFEYESF